MDEQLEQKLAEHRENRKEILQKRKEAEARKAAKAAIPVLKKKIRSERTDTGLYYLRFEGGGELPENLKGFFTTVAKMKEAVRAAYGSEDWLCQQ